MKKITTNLNASRVIIAGASVSAVVAFVFAVFASNVYALSPNILVGQDMTVGSTGQNVVVLQGLLSERGYLNVPRGVAYGYYGSLTKDAVARYQSTHSVSPPAGYYGSITKSAMHSEFAPRGWLTLLGW